MMQAGKYWIGDLCYVLFEDWDEFCAITMPGNKCLDGEFSLRDGRRFAFSRTAHGDGVYEDQHGRTYPVDAGLIGCMKVEDIPEADRQGSFKYGHVVDIDRDFTVDTSYDDHDWDGVIHIGGIRINTDVDDDDDDSDEESGESEWDDDDNDDSDGESDESESDGKSEDED